MKKRNITLITALAAAAVLASGSRADVALPDPGDVGPYRVIFVTSISPAATDTTIALLNTFVTGLAQDTGAVDDGGVLGTTWSVVGATSLVDVYTNTGLVDTGGVPFYLVDGTAFATDNADLWALGGQTLNVNEDGDAGNWGGGTWVHTGLEAGGTGPVTAVGAELDSASISHGGLDTGYNPWYGTGDTWAGGIDNGAIFAVSGVIADEAVAADPEITSITSLGGGVFELTLKGENNTSYEFRSSTTLGFTPGDLVPLTGGGTDVTTDGSGDATVQMSLAGSANFVRAVGP